MSFPLIQLATPTRLALEWGWLLVTRANFIAYALAAALFIAGATVRLPGVRKDIEAVERARGGQPGGPA
jgi:hypothetical protein